MKTSMIEVITNEELIDLLIESANLADIPSENNFLNCVRVELLSRLKETE